MFSILITFQNIMHTRSKTGNKTGFKMLAIGLSRQPNDSFLFSWEQVYPNCMVHQWGPSGFNLEAPQILILMFGKHFIEWHCHQMKHSFNWNVLIAYFHKGMFSAKLAQQPVTEGRDCSHYVARGTLCINKKSCQCCREGRNQPSLV